MEKYTHSPYPTLNCIGRVATDHKEVFLKNKNLTVNKVVNKYEVLFIIRSGTTEAGREASIEKFKDLIEKAGGTIDLIDKWGNRRFAYPIDFKYDGFYVLIYFTSSPALPQELERVMLISEEVVRFMVVNRNKMGEPIERKRREVITASSDETAEKGIANNDVVVAENSKKLQPTPAGEAESTQKLVSSDDVLSTKTEQNKIVY